VRLYDNLASHEIKKMKKHNEKNDHLKFGLNSTNATLNSKKNRYHQNILKIIHFTKKNPQKKQTFKTVLMRFARVHFKQYGYYIHVLYLIVYRHVTSIQPNLHMRSRLFSST
jgi:hypothetical protein